MIMSATPYFFRRKMLARVKATSYSAIISKKM